MPKPKRQSNKKLWNIFYHKTELKKEIKEHGIDDVLNRFNKEVKKAFNLFT